MQKQLIYDLPIRIFHFLFAGLFIVAYFIAKSFDDDSPLFNYHMLAGFLLSFTVLLRILWGWVGTKYSRFNSFALRPKDLKAYFLNLFTGSKKKWVGHNPASSWVSLVMFGLALGLGLTGYLMGSGQKETFEDIHELMANGFLIIALMHIAGVALHALRHQDQIAMSIVNGTKCAIPASDSISTSKPGVALFFVGLILTFTTYLVTHFNSQNQSLNFFGTTLQLGESDENEDHD